MAIQYNSCSRRVERCPRQMVQSGLKRRVYAPLSGQAHREYARSLLRGQTLSSRSPTLPRPLLHSLQEISTIVRVSTCGTDRRPPDTRSGWQRKGRSMQTCKCLWDARHQHFCDTSERPIVRCRKSHKDVNAPAAAVADANMPPPWCDTAHDTAKAAQHVKPR